MTDAGWAEKMARKGVQYISCITDNEVYSLIAKLLKAEHARSVRIVKGAAQFQFRETDTNEWVEGYEAACHDILTALQRGRGGKG